MQLAKTPIQPVSFLNQTIFIKRDDLLAPAFSGNKARKFYHFLNADLTDCELIIGHGSPQANSLYSLAVLADIKQCRLDFYVDHLPSYLAGNPQGNYKAALDYGANIIVNPDPNRSIIEYIEQVVLPAASHAVFVPEGGRCEYAEVGVALLAEEIKEWVGSQVFDDVRIVLPAGTGTTALFLQKHVPYEVQTCACVGGSDYLRMQFNELSNNTDHHPTILSTPKKYHFGKLYLEFYDVWQRLRDETNIEFDLLYDPLAWLCLEHSLKDTSVDDKRPIVYIHQGGLKGNETMLPRYKRKLSLRR